MISKCSPKADALQAMPVASITQLKDATKNLFIKICLFTIGIKILGGDRVGEEDGFEQGADGKSD